MPDKKQIKTSIAEIARQLGRAPSLLEFVARSGISKYSVSRFFPRWNDAIRATGLEPNRLKVRPEDSELLKDWGQTVRKRRAIPTKYAYRRKGKCDPRTLEERFGGWTSVPRAFCKFAKGKRAWADVVELLPAPVTRTLLSKAACSQTNEGSLSSIPPKPLQHLRLKGRATYGNPTNFLGLRHEPVNEQGVVLLFGMLANDLGYRIEAVQKGFPDCEAMPRSLPNDGSG